MSVPAAPASVVRLADYRALRSVPLEPLEDRPPIGLVWSSQKDRIAISIVLGGPVGDADRLALVDYLRDLADTFEGPPGEVLFAVEQEGA